MHTNMHYAVQTRKQPARRDQGWSLLFY